ncbi:MAG: insulinase family protein [Acidobacteriota bacterium]|nr:insulinase family protein [Acidobacteriota bacterium]
MRDSVLRPLGTWLCALSALALTSAVPTWAQAPDRGQPPPLGPPPELRLPAIQKTTLANGVPVWVIEQHRVPMVQVNVLLRGGSSLDRAGRFGLASLVAAMLDEGAGTRSALELADAVEYLGADLSTSSSFDYSAVRLSTPVKNLAPALGLLADVVLRPTFPANELERLKKERLTALVQAQDNPAAIIGYAFPRVVFGPTHRYGTPASGLGPALQAMTADEVRAFYKEAYVAGYATIVVVGDVQADQAKAALDRVFAGWPGSGSRAAAAPIPQAPQLTRREVVIVDKPGAAQSQIRIGWVGVPRTTPEYATLEVLNTILGGSFTSRLNQNLRERNGFTYGAGSIFDMRTSAGPFFATAGVQTDKTAEALKEFFVELDGIQKPVPEAELDKAKNYVALGFPGEFETSRNLAQKLEELIVYNLPEDTYRTFVSEVHKVTVADAQTAAARYIQPDKMAVVVVGDRTQIEPGIARLNLGPVRVVPLEEFFK